MRKKGKRKKNHNDNESVKVNFRGVLKCTKTLHLTAAILKRI